MIYRALVFGSVLVTAGCMGDSVGDIDYSVEGTASLHIAPDGSAVRSTPHGAQTVVLASSTMTDLRSKITAAEFPALKPVYTCDGEFCTELSAGKFVATVQLDGASYVTAADRRILLGYEDGAPPSLVVAIGAIDAIMNNSDWH